MVGQMGGEWVRGGSTLDAGSGPESVTRRKDRLERPTPGQLPPPPGLEAYTFAVEGDEYAILGFTLPELEAPLELSPAERQVVQAVIEGNSNAAIAKARGTSVNTVANQLRSIYSKLKISNRIELIRRCRRAGEKSR